MFSFISVPFGYVLEWIYTFTNNYAIALLLFAVVVKLVLLPFGIKQQKNSVQQAKLYPKIRAIEKKYAGRDDAVTQRKKQEEMTKLYQDEKFNPLSGCLPLLIQFPIIIALYDVIRQPLTYLMHLPKETVTKFKEVMLTFEQFKDAKVEAIQEINIISMIEKHSDAFNAVLTEAGKTIEDIPDMGLFGLDLGEIPKLPPESGNWLIILIPVLSLVSAFVSSMLTKKFTYQPPSSSNNEGSMKVMTYLMPFMSLYIAFMVPAAVGLYWVFQNLLGPIQQFILSKAIKVPTYTEEELKEAEKAIAKAEKPQKKRVAAPDKKRSIVYDDDDDETEEAEANASETKKTPDVKPISSISEAPPMKGDVTEELAAKKGKKKKSLIADDDDNETEISGSESAEADKEQEASSSDK